MRLSFRLLAALSVISLALMPDDLAAQRRQQRGGTAAVKQPQMKVLPTTVIGNFLSSDIANGATFSPDSKLVALSTFSSGILLWDTASGRLIRTLTQPNTYFMESAFTEDGRQMVTGHKDGTIRIWDLETGAVSVASLPRARTKGKAEDPEPVSAIWNDPRGDLFVTAGGGANLAIWSLTSKKPVLTIPNRPDSISSGGNMRISPDGANLVTAGGDTVAIYDAKSGARTSTFTLPEKHKFIDDAIVREDEAVVLASTPECELGELLLYSLKEKSVIVPIYRPALCDKPKDGPQPLGLRVLHGPDSSRILITREGDPDLRIFDVATRRMVNTFRWPRVEKPHILGASGDMRLVASKEPNGVAIRELDNGKLVKELRSFGGYSESMLASADGMQFLTQRSIPEGSKAQPEVSIRKIEDLNPVTFKLASEGGWRIHGFAPAAGLAIASNDKDEVALIPLDGKPLRKLAVPLLRSVSKLSLSPDGKLAIVHGSFAEKQDNTAKSGDTKGGRPDTSEESADGGVAMVDTATGAVREKLATGEKYDVVNSVFSRDGSKLALALRDGRAEIWDSATLKRLKVLPAAKEDADVFSLAFSADDRALVGAGMFDDDVFVWNLESGKIQRSYKMPELLASRRYATSLAMSRDRKLLAAGIGQRGISSGDTGVERGNIQIWDAETGKLRTTLRSQRGAITALAFSPNDKWLVSGSIDGTVQYWDRATLRPLATAIAGPDGRWIVLGEGGFYAASDNAQDAINVVRGTAVASGPAVAKILARPDLIELLLKGDNAKYQDAVKKLDLQPVAP